MILRVMQIFIPESNHEKLEELLEGREILGRWRDTDADQLVLHLLVPAEETEPIMDRFEQEYADTKGFHVLLFPVEAVLPRVIPEPEEDAAQESDPSEEKRYGKQRISREELYSNVNEGLGVTRVFMGLAALSVVVAAVGLLRDDVAVIIGAMVIAPLLGPNVAMSLATTLGDFDLLRRALITNIAGSSAAFGLAICGGLLFIVDPEIPSIASRTQVDIGDILLALAAGCAGTLAFTQGLSGAVIGVMVAVALVPPLVTCGMLLGNGSFALASGAFLLTITNVICINLAGVATFLLQGVRPRSWWEVKRARKATTQAILIWIVLLLILGLVLWLNQ
ncbi:TIGR00341 family protein [uncultured Gimesia sp.]|uniref:TIGR00341 family protein n=1 Tax=uncultured Gimesia sp. TaxID=1678688 RepID=UPI0030D78985|tara:strand:+ start:106206 stop:107213 length:1008 start_codon:yes stop_codon:yes gene_type:complete